MNIQLCGLPLWLSGKESACNAGDAGGVGSVPGSGRSPGEEIPTPVFLGFSGGSDGKKKSACNAGDPDLIPGLGRFPAERHGNPLQSCCLENPHGQSLAGYSPWGLKNQTQLSNQTTTIDYLKGFPSGSVVKNTPAMQELQETRVLSPVGKISCRRAWQPTPVLLPGESHGQGSLKGYSTYGRKESDMTEQLI